MVTWSDNEGPGSRFALGEWEVDLARNRLVGQHRQRRLEPKLTAVLATLANARGATVTKDALLDAVWPRRYVVEGVLKRTVSELRRVLGDDARAPRFIETIYKVGYRLIAPPRRIAARDRRVVTGSCVDIERIVTALANQHGTASHLTLIIESDAPGGRCS